MKILVVYREQSEVARSVETFLRDLTRMHDVRENDIKVVNPDSREGVDLCKAYGIMTYPSVIVTDSNGKYVHGWFGELPLRNDLMGYAFSLQ